MLSNSATPIYYGLFREKVLAGEIPICETIELEMNRIDELIADPNYYYDDRAIDGFIAFCEDEMTLTDGADLTLLPTFKLWAESIFAWFYFELQEVPTPMANGDIVYVKKYIKRRLCISSSQEVRQKLYLQRLSRLISWSSIPLLPTR